MTNKKAGAQTQGSLKVTTWDRKGCTDGCVTVITDSRGHGLFEALHYGNHKKTKATAERIVKVWNILAAIQDKTALEQLCKKAFIQYCKESPKKYKLDNPAKEIKTHSLMWIGFYNHFMDNMKFISSQI
jgi:hypothetical protein